MSKKSADICKYIESVQQSYYRHFNKKIPEIKFLGKTKYITKVIIMNLLFGHGIRHRFGVFRWALMMFRIFRTLPVSRHEDLSTFAICQPQLNDLQQRVSRNEILDGSRYAIQYSEEIIERARNFNITCASIHTKECNAFSVLFEDEKFAVLFFSENTNKFIDAIVAMYSRLLELEYTDKGLAIGSLRHFDRLNIIEKSPENLVDIAFIIRDFIMEENFEPKDLRGSSPWANRIIETRLALSMWGFFIGHELAHVLLGSSITEKEKYFPREFEIQEEYAADSTSFILNCQSEFLSAIQYHGDNSEIIRQGCVVSTYASFDLVLRAYWMIEAVCYKLLGISPGKSSIRHHPPYIDRITELQNIAIKIAPDLSGQIEQTSIYHQEMMSTIGETVVIWCKEHDRGKELSKTLLYAFGIDGENYIK